MAAAEKSVPEEQAKPEEQRDASWERVSEEEEGDDLFPEEEDNGDQRTEKARIARSEATAAGLVPMSGDWRSLVTKHLHNAGVPDEVIPEAVVAVGHAARATCCVRRAKGTRNAASGTGLLLQPKSPNGWLVITNNHVIMNEDEARTARVVFDFDTDSSAERTRTFTVSKLVANSPRTVNAADTIRKDFSILLLDAGKADDAFFQDHALPFEETTRVQSTSPEFLKMAGLKSMPLVMFSHARGLAKSLSVGSFPSEVSDQPCRHIRHDLPTLPGSSGGNLIFSSIEDHNFLIWKAAFVHYRRTRAVAWQGIGTELRAQANFKPELTKEGT